MRKNIIFLIIVLIVLGLTSVFLLSQIDRPSTTEEIDDDRTAEMVEAAFAGQMSIRCSFDEDRTGDSIAFIKDGLVRTETITEYSQENAIHRDDVLYLWEEGQNQGVIRSTIGEEGFGDIRDIREQLRVQEVTCREETLIDSIFDPPVGVDFVDFVGIVSPDPVQIDN